MTLTTQPTTQTIEQRCDQLALRNAQAKSVIMLLLGALDVTEGTIDIPFIQFADALHATYDLLDVQ